MKREIKFRAWDKDMREMIFVSGIQFDPHSPKEKPNIIDERNDLRDLDDVELMQFTGLKDKNGKEIYEEDIVDISKFEGSAIYRMVINDIMQMPNELYGSNVDWYEVIGNRIENPELLK